MEVLRGYRFRLYPNEDQEILMIKTFGCSRYIYNYFLNEKAKYYQELGQTKSAYDCCKDIKALSNEYPWLKEVDSCALRTAIFDLEDAFQRFFKKQGNYPKYKSKYYKNSYRTNNITSEYKGTIYNSIKLDLNKKEITLPKLKEVKIRGYRNLNTIKGRIINATISKENNRYYVSVCVDEPITQTQPTGKGIIGIDLGIKSIVTTSDYEKYDNQKVTNKYEKKLAHEQRNLARKVKGSKNYYKNKARINVIYRKMKNTRKYYLHQISKTLTDTYQVIVAETLKIKKMLQNSRLAKSIQDVSLYELIRQLEYKSRNKGIKFYQIDPYYPSSQRCSHCGTINKEMKKLNKREYECLECNNKLDRDYNAALNIMREGLDRYMAELAI